MKVRLDFVTNSSSSSFVCDICGANETAYNLDLLDIEACECENGHQFCQEHLIELSREEMIQCIMNHPYWNHENKCEEKHTREELEPLTDDALYNMCVEDYYAVPEEMCPICRFEEPHYGNLAGYLKKEYGISREEVFKKVKEKNKRRKKLYDYEYVEYVCEQKNTSVDELLKKLKGTYERYSDFTKYVRGR